MALLFLSKIRCGCILVCACVWLWEWKWVCVHGSQNSMYLHCSKKKQQTGRMDVRTAWSCTRRLLCLGRNNFGSYHLPVCNGRSDGGKIFSAMQGTGGTLQRQVLPLKLDGRIVGCMNCMDLCILFWTLNSVGAICFYLQVLCFDTLIIKKTNTCYLLCDLIWLEDFHSLKAPNSIKYVLTTIECLSLKFTAWPSPWCHYYLLYYNHHPIPDLLLYSCGVAERCALHLGKITFLSLSGYIDYMCECSSPMCYGHWQFSLWKSLI